MRIGLSIILLIFSAVTFAAANSSINQDLNNLMQKITQVNNELAQKQKTQTNLNNAIADSNAAISQSNVLLSQLKQKRDLDQTQLNDIAKLLPQLTMATESAESSVIVAMNKIYQQLRSLQASSDSVLIGNTNLANQRQKMYLIQLLKLDQANYKNLQTKLDQLNDTNIKISREIARLNKKLGDTTQYKQQLLVNKQGKLHQAEQLTVQINRQQQLLSDLKTRQVALNQLMQQMAARSKTQANNSVTNNNMVKVGKADNSYEDNSPFLARKLAAPVDADIAVPFGTARDGVRNNGILFAANNNISVYSISSGQVVFSGPFAGFGQMIIIDNGDNYTSIYAGILPRVQKGQSVRAGSVIANAGTSTNQPMGGVYFELRHLGKPVNPTSLVD